jgi:transposase
MNARLQSDSRYFLVGITMDTAVKQGTRKGRPNYSMEFKRRLAVAACAPNVSVSKLALEHEVNANMVFKWRRQYRAGLLGTDAGAAFLPVAVQMAQGGGLAQVTCQASAPEVGGGHIEILIGSAVVRVMGKVDAQLLRTVVQSLRP